MPKLGMEPIRRASLIKATIDEIGVSGTLDVTVSRIAKRAGVSSALAHHYFGSKEIMFLAAMRHLLSLYGGEVRQALLEAECPEAQARALIRASFSTMNFQREVVAAWLNFYVLAQTLPEARRLYRVYRHRLASTLRRVLRPIFGADSRAVAQRIAAMIDGVYLHAALGGGELQGADAVALVEGYLDLELARL